MYSSFFFFNAILHGKSFHGGGSGYFIFQVSKSWVILTHLWNPALWRLRQEECCLRHVWATQQNPVSKSIQDRKAYRCVRLGSNRHALSNTN